MPDGRAEFISLIALSHELGNEFGRDASLTQFHGDGRLALALAQGQFANQLFGHASIVNVAEALEPFEPVPREIGSYLFGKYPRFDFTFGHIRDREFTQESLEYCVGVGLNRVRVPAGGRSTAVHTHGWSEEIFFVLRGAMKVVCEKDGQRWEAVIGERDLISVPPGVYREEHNIGDEDALMCVMLGSPKPITPVYPPDSPLSKIKR